MCANNYVKNKITICIPHWEAEEIIVPCLRSIRKHSRSYNIEVIVVDNGSRDKSLDYLKSLRWIKLLTRPEENNDNWPKNVFTAWDCGLKCASGEFFLIMHTDVFVKSNDWLELFLESIKENDSISGVGGWKLELENPLYVFQKKLFGFMLNWIKVFFRQKKIKAELFQKKYPRDYCAMYKTEIIKNNNIQFGLGGYSQAKQLWNLGYATKNIPLKILDEKIYHIAHATAALGKGKKLNHKKKQKQTEKKLDYLLGQDWIKELKQDSELDN